MITHKLVVPFKIDGKKLALILWSQEARNEEAVVFTGKASYRDNVLEVGLEGNPNFVIYQEWFPRIKKVTSDIKKIACGADYYLCLSVGKKPKDVSDLDFKKTGLKWPN